MEFERGEPMVLTLTRDAGLFFLDIETGAVEGWTACGRPAPSPGNRFVLLESPKGIRLIDRLEGRTFAWDSPELSLVRRIIPRWPMGDYTPTLLGWGTGASEHLIFRWGNAFAVVNASIEATAWFELDDMVEGTVAPGLWLAHPEGKYLARYQSSGTLTSINLMTGEHRSAEIPAPPRYSRRVEVQTLSGGEGLAAISHDEGKSTCIVTRFGWDLAVLSEASMLCIQAPWLGVDLSPDGKWVATVTLLLGKEPADPGVWQKLAITSLFDTLTGEEFMRVHGALPSHDALAVHDHRSRWLADSSGLVLQTRTEARVLNVDGSWGTRFDGPESVFGLGFVIPSSDDPALFDRPLHLIYQPCALDDATCRMLSARVTDPEREIATAQLILQAAPNAAWRGGPGWTRGVFAGAYNRTSWGLSSGELRVHLTSGGPYEGLGYIPSREPRVERPPFFDATTLTVATGDSCQHLRAWFDAEAASLACLPAKTVVESVKPPPNRDGYVHGDRSSHLTWSYGYWIHVRTDEGLDGWMHSDDLTGWRP